MAAAEEVAARLEEEMQQHRAGRSTREEKEKEEEEGRVAGAAAAADAADAVAAQNTISAEPSATFQAELCAARKQAKKMEGVAAMAQAQLLALNEQFDIIADQAARATAAGAAGEFGYVIPPTPAATAAVSSTSSSSPERAHPPSSSSSNQNKGGVSSSIRKNVRSRYATPQLRRAIDAVDTLRGALASTCAAGKSARKSSRRVEAELAHAKDQCRTLEASADTLREELLKARRMNGELLRKQERWEARSEASVVAASATTATTTTSVAGSSMVTPASSPRKVTGMAGRGFLSPEAGVMQSRSMINDKENTTAASFSAATTASCSVVGSAARRGEGEEMTPASSSSFLTASFTPYSSFTPLSVKISRFAAQMAGAAGSGSGIPEVESTTSGAKRQLDME